MKRALAFLLISILFGVGCGGTSTPFKGDKSAALPQGPTETMPDPALVGAVVPVSGVPKEGKPADQRQLKEGRGIIKLYLKAYDHCEAQGGCDEEEDIETEEDRRRYSVPYRRQ